MEAIPSMGALARTLTVLAGLAAVTGCSKNEEPSPSRDPAAGSPAVSAPEPAASAAPAAAAKLAWKAPEGWEAKPAGGIRLATYRVPGPEGAEPADLSVTQVGGSVDANIQRWVGQFEGVKPADVEKTTRRVGDLEVTIVHIAGRFLGMPIPGAPAPEAKDAQAMLAAIVHTSPQPHFFKLVGPVKTVDAARPAFDELVKSLEQR